VSSTLPAALCWLTPVGAYELIRASGIPIAPVQVAGSAIVAAAGPELLVGVTADPSYGPLLSVGTGGTATDLLDDRARCLGQGLDRTATDRSRPVDGRAVLRGLEH
jgi:hypothetical protein